jgi:RimJ/RimL family protein N-acetyltransferase
MVSSMRTGFSTCLTLETVDNFAPPLVIETARLRLRRPVPSDAVAVFDYASDPEVVHYMDWPRSETVETVAAYLEASGSAWQSGEEWYWVVTRRDIDRAVGGAALRIKGHSADFGYVLGRGYWRSGLGTEVASAIVSLALAAPRHQQGMGNLRCRESCVGAGTREMRPGAGRGPAIILGPSEYLGTPA